MGDIVLSTDNEYFIKGSHKNHNIITYEKGLAKPEKMTVANITKTVMKGFGTGVGGFSNTATCLYAMAAIFDKPGHEDQYNEIMTRIKLLREIVGQEIDRIKGADKPSLPKEWRKVEKITSQDTPEQVLAKMRQNAMVVSKKPYFFRYLYPELNRRFKQFEASYNQISRDMFGLKFKKLLKKENKTEEEKNLVRRYQKYSPLITAPCIMNKLCREFEDVDFDIKFQKTPPDAPIHASSVSMLPTFEEKYAETFSADKLAEVKKLYQTYTSKNQLTHMDNLFQSSLYSLRADDYEELHSTVYDAFIQDLQRQLVESSLAGNGEEFLFYCNRLSKKYNSFNWGFAWTVLADQIIKLIPQGRSVCPVRNPEGKYTYLGERYSLKELTVLSQTERDALEEELEDDFFDENVADAMFYSEGENVEENIKEDNNNGQTR